MVQQLKLNLDNYSPAAERNDYVETRLQNWHEHRRAEIERLDNGWAGCGCDICQALYKELDLTKYGPRVKRYGDIIAIAERPGGGGNFTIEDGHVIGYIDGSAYGISQTGKSFYMGRKETIKAVIADPELKYGTPLFDQVIELERTLSNKEVIDNGKPRSSNKRAVKTSGIRARPANNLKHKPVNTRQFKKR